MDAVIFRKASGPQPLNCAFSGSKHYPSARAPLLTLFKNFSCVLRIFFVGLCISPIDSPAWSTAPKSQCPDGALSSTWITAEMIFCRHTFPLAPRKPLSTPRCISFRGIAPKSMRCFHHLDCVFPNRFSSPCIHSKRSSTHRHTFGHLSIQKRW